MSDHLYAQLNKNQKTHLNIEIITPEKTRLTPDNAKTVDLSNTDVSFAKFLSLYNSQKIQTLKIMRTTRLKKTETLVTTMALYFPFLKEIFVDSTFNDELCVYIYQKYNREIKIYRNYQELQFQTTA